jgi:cytochrome c oxidase subunit 1
MFDQKDRKLVLAHLYVAFSALLLGGIAGIAQGLVRGGLLKLPLSIDYYQLLTAHGVLLALVFTTFFIIGFLHSGLSHSLGGVLRKGVRLAGWWGFWLMTVGTTLTTVMIVLSKASVLYTFYAPMQASPYFYIGLTLVVVGTWVGGGGMLYQYFKWKKDNRGEVTPLFAFMSVSTIIMWIICSIGIAVAVLFQFIPWSFQWVPTINVMLSRTLFWFFGHPLVYFWLMPAYICWYVIIPKIIGGTVFSDALARLTFILLLIFSIPVGFHHQLMEPGVSAAWKFLQVILTFAVVVPSLITAFSLFAMFETAGRKAGAKGLFGWLKILPWKDVRFFAPFMAMVVFIPGGAGGIVNASNQMNQVVHNTLWVTGHFHLTVATAVALTFFGITYWLVPVITNRELSPTLNRLGIIQTWIWAGGMAMMSGAMHWVGLLGSPRRTSFTTYADNPDALAWGIYHVAMALGGVILFVGVLLIIFIFMELVNSRKLEPTTYPVDDNRPTVATTPLFLEKWHWWIGITIVLILVAYTIPVLEMMNGEIPGSKPFVTW